MKKILLVLLSITLFACQESEKTEPKQTAETNVSDSPAVLEEVPEQPIPKGQLYKDIMPDEIFLNLTIVPDDEYFHGKTRILANVTKSQKQYYIHGNLLEVDNVQIKDAKNNVIKGEYEQVSDSGVARLSFTETIKTGKIELEISYRLLPSPIVNDARSVTIYWVVVIFSSFISKVCKSKF